VALGNIDSAEAIDALRRRMGIEEDAHVKLEIEEAIRDAEKSCATGSD
jgi:hypothetical protein